MNCAAQTLFIFLKVTVTYCTKVESALIILTEDWFSKLTAKVKLLSWAGQMMGVSSKVQTV